MTVVQSDHALAATEARLGYSVYKMWLETDFSDDAREAKETPVYLATLTEEFLRAHATANGAPGTSSNA